MGLAYQDIVTVAKTASANTSATFRPQCSGARLMPQPPRPPARDAL